MSATKKDVEEGTPTEQATGSPPAPVPQLQKGPLLALLALVFALGVAGTAVGSVALKKANDVNSDLDQLSEKGICDGERIFIQSFTFPPIFVPSPNTMTHVPEWDFVDPSWFGTPGNRVIYHKDPMYDGGTADFVAATPIGYISGVETFIKPVTDPTDFPVNYMYATAQLNGFEGDFTYAGIIEGNGSANKLSILGGTGYWENFSGHVEGQFDVENLQFSAKIYQTCQ